MDAKLRVVRGPLSGETIRVPVGKLLIGRETDCQLRLDSQAVSLHHCVLLLDEYALRIRDLGSTNGTFVNGHRVGKHESILLHEDTVSIDNLTFQIDLGSGSDLLAMSPAEAEPAASSARSTEPPSSMATRTRSFPSKSLPPKSLPLTPSRCPRLSHRPGMSPRP